MCYTYFKLHPFSVTPGFKLHPVLSYTSFELHPLKCVLHKVLITHTIEVCVTHILKCVLHIL